MTRLQICYACMAVPGLPTLHTRSQLPTPTKFVWIPLPNTVANSDRLFIVTPTMQPIFFLQQRISHRCFYPNGIVALSWKLFRAPNYDIRWKNWKVEKDNKTELYLLSAVERCIVGNDGAAYLVGKDGAAFRRCSPIVGKDGAAYRRFSPSWKRWRCLQVALLSMASQCCVGHHFSFSSESRPSSVRRSRPLDSFTLRSDPAKKDKFSF